MENNDMEKIKKEQEAFSRNAVEWQLEGHRSKVTWHNLFVTFVVAIIGFSVSLIFVCDCTFGLLKQRCAATLYFISLIIQFVVLVWAFILSRFLIKIAFDYSTALGNLAYFSIETINELYEQAEKEHKVVDDNHSKYYLQLNVVFGLFALSVLLLIIAVLVYVYSG